MKNLFILIIIFAARITNAQVSVCFEKDTLVFQRTDKDETKYLKLSLQIPKDSLVKIAINDTRTGTMPSVEFIIDSANTTFTADTASRKEQIIPFIIKKDTLKTPDRIRSIILVIDIVNYKPDYRGKQIKNTCTKDTLIILINPVGYADKELNLPHPGDAAIVCIKKTPVEYYEFIASKRSTPRQIAKVKSDENFTFSQSSGGKILVDSMKLKFEDKTLCEIQVFAKDKDNPEINYLFENKNDIPIRGHRNKTNMAITRLIDFTNVTRFSTNPVTFIRKFIYLGDVFKIIPFLENYTFDYAPGDTVITISQNKCSDPGQLPRSSIVSMLQLRVMNDMMAALADRPNGVIQAHFRAKLNTNFINIGKTTLFHETEIVASYAQYSKANRFLRLQTDKTDNNRYANLMNIIERPTFFLGLRENILKKEYRPTSTKLNIYFLAGIGFTRVKDTMLVTDSSFATTKTIEDRVLKFSLIGIEGRVKFMAMKGFYSEIGAQLLAPFLLTQSVKEDVSPVLDEDEVPFSAGYSFSPEVPKFKDRLIVSPYINFTIYPNKHSHSATVHIRGQWFKSLTNKNSFLQLQVGANLDLKKILGKTASAISTNF